MLVYGIGLMIGSPSTTTVCPGPSPGPTVAILSCVCTWYTPFSSAFADIEYGTTEFPEISNTLPGGSLASISHLLPALVDSENIDVHALKSLSTRLTSLPWRVRTSPVCNDCLLKVSSSILTKRLCNCAWTPCASALGRIASTQSNPTVPSAKITLSPTTITFLSTIIIPLINQKVT